MNIKIVVALVAGAALIGGGYFFINGSSKGGAASTGENAAAQPGAFTGSMFDLAKRGGEWKCTVDASAQTGGGAAAASGTVYVSGDNVRAEYDVTVQGYGSMKAYMIADGEFVYSWSSMVPQGVKTAQQKAQASNGAPASGQGADANHSYTYDCQPARVDASLFTPPTNVTFMVM